MIIPRYPVVLLFGLVLSATALAQMPDISQMSGVPLPTGDLAAGSVSVRVVRGDLTNNVASQPVELHAHAASRTWKAVTDETGRATFTGIGAGTVVHASTVVDGERLESQEFPMPATGGVRVILVAGKGGGATGASGTAPSGAPAVKVDPSAPAQPGSVVFGGQSRVVVELADAAVDVYYLLDIANVARHAVTAEPLVFTAPEGALGLTVLEGSSPQAKVEGERFVVSGPFQPGTTSVQLAYQIPYTGGTLRFRQALPAALSQTALVVRKVGEMHLASPQAPEHREMDADGKRYIMATGTGLKPGATLDVELTGLPHHPRWPRYLALALVVGIAAGGAWLAMGDPRAETSARARRLEARREQLFGDLVKVEEQHLAGRLDGGRYAARREELIAQLETVYGELEYASTALARPAEAPSAASHVRASA